MAERESIRYDGLAYRATLVCNCGAAHRFSVGAPAVAGQRPDADPFIRQLSAKIEETGWVEGWSIQAKSDKCPKCYAAWRGRVMRRLGKEIRAS